MAKTSGGVRGNGRAKFKRTVAKSATITQPKRSKQTREQRTVDYIREQVGIDLNKYRNNVTRGFDKRTGINVNWKAMPTNEKNTIERLSRQYGGRFFDVVDNGAWMKFIRFK